MNQIEMVSEVLAITPEDFSEWLDRTLREARSHVVLCNKSFVLHSVCHNPVTVVGRTKSGAVTIEVIGEVVVATTTKL